MSINYLLTYAHLNALGTTVLKSSGGFLETVTINTKGATNTLTLYDNTAGSGKVIAVIDTTSNVASLNFGGINFTVGLTAVLAGGTAADVTISFA